MKPKPRLMLYGLVGLIFALSASIVGLAQDREQYVISAKAGGVNSVSGDPAFRRRDTREWQPLTSNNDLESGDVVRTGATGRVEMLLSPGSYLRAAENAEFELTNGALDALQVKFVSGSIIVEVAGADEARTLIAVATPQTKVAIDRRGLYRINLLPNNATEVLVRKGRATIGEGLSATLLKDGKRIVVSGGSSVVAKFERKEHDSFDLWSEQRAETLVEANRRLSNSTIARSYGNYSISGFGWQRGYRSSGFWIYDPFFRSRTFLPFYAGWSSPYGRRYSRGFRFPWHGYRHSSLFGSAGPRRSGLIIRTIRRPSHAPRHGGRRR